MDIVQRLTAGDMQQWEHLVTVSLQRGMSLHLEVSSIKVQVGLRQIFHLLWCRSLPTS
jgi:hypothetical protein